MVGILQAVEDEATSVGVGKYFPGAGWLLQALQVPTEVDVKPNSMYPAAHGLRLSWVHV
jgi:hypothetical protein